MGQNDGGSCPRMLKHVMRTGEAFESYASYLCALGQKIKSLRRQDAFHGAAEKLLRAAIQGE